MFFSGATVLVCRVSCNNHLRYQIIESALIF